MVPRFHPIAIWIWMYVCVYGCFKIFMCMCISTVKYQKRPTPLLVVVQERVKTVQFY